MKLKNLIETAIRRTADTAIIDGALSSKEEELFRYSDSADYNISDHGVTSLNGCPRNISNNFYADHNLLKNLIGGPDYVGGTYDVRYNKLTSLEGCPTRVSTLNCCSNKLKDLKHAPVHVSGDFLCSSNLITSLEFAPETTVRHFKCVNNRLEDLKDIHKHVKKVGGEFCCYDNPIKSHILGLMLIEIGEAIRTWLGDGHDVDAILNKWKNQGRKGALGCQRDLIDAGYKELAQL